MAGRLHLIVPDVFVKSPPQPPEVLPIPGNVTLADLQPKNERSFPFFLIPWKPYKDKPQHPIGSSEETRLTESIPVEFSGSLYRQGVLQQWDMEGAMAVIFKHAQNDLPRVLESFGSPFRDTSANGDGIVWTVLQRVGRAAPAERLGGKKMRDRHKAFTRGPPWSVYSVGEGGCIVKNYIYDGEGNVCAEVDFGHQQLGSVHYHGLIEGSMDHSSTADEDHALPWTVCPWFWCAIPDLRRMGSKPEHGFQEWGVPMKVDEVLRGTFQWLAVSVTYDDQYGERQFSDDW